MPNLHTGFATSPGLSPSLSDGAGSVTPAGLLLQESGGTNAFLLEDSSGVILLQS